MKIQEKFCHTLSSHEVLKASCQPLKRTSETILSLAPHQASNEEKGGCFSCIANFFASIWKCLTGLCSRKGSQSESVKKEEEAKSALENAKKKGRELIGMHLNEKNNSFFVGNAVCVIIKLDGKIMDCHFGLFGKDSLKSFHDEAVKKMEKALDGKTINGDSIIEINTLTVHKDAQTKKFDILSWEDGLNINSKNSSYKSVGGGSSNGLTAKETANWVANHGTKDNESFKSFFQFLVNTLLKSQN